MRNHAKSWTKIKKIRNHKTALEIINNNYYKSCEIIKKHEIMQKSYIIRNHQNHAKIIRNYEDYGKSRK